MRFLIANIDYPKFIDGFYRQHPGLEKEPFSRQMRERMETMFGVADFYSNALADLGHEAIDVHVNNANAQRAWQREFAGTTRRRGGDARFGQEQIEQIVEQQLIHYQPDVFLVQAMESFSRDFFKRVRRHARRIVGQFASPILRQTSTLKYYDLVLSSLPNLVEFYRALDVPSQLLRLAFDPRVLAKVSRSSPKYDVTFIGGLSNLHEGRRQLLEWLCQRAEIMIWGYGGDDLPEDSPIRRRLAGEVWGVDMYQVLADSRITLNQHIGIASEYANNLRLYEACGIGTLLLTDAKENLGDMFEAGKEVLTFSSPQQCLSAIEATLADEPARERIAQAGQERALRDHTYAKRVRELLDIIGNTPARSRA